MAIIEKAMSLRKAGPYQLQAAIAAIHAEARSAADTDWAQIVALYRRLMQRLPSPIVALNQAVAVAMCEGWEKGLESVEAAGASGQLEKYHLFHSARADLLRRLQRWDEAGSAYRRALELTGNQVERQYLERRLSEISGLT